MYICIVNYSYFFKTYKRMLCDNNMIYYSNT